MGDRQLSRRFALIACTLALLLSAFGLWKAGRERDTSGEPSAHAGQAGHDSPWIGSVVSVDQAVAHVAPLRRTEFTSNSRLLITESTDQEVILWDTESGGQIKRLIDPGQPERYLGDPGLIFRYYGLASVSESYWFGVRSEEACRLQKKSLKSQEVEQEYELEGESLPTSVHLTLDGKYVVACGRGLHVWERKTARPVWTPSATEKVFDDLEAESRKKLNVDASRPTYSWTQINLAARLKMYDSIRPDGRPLRFAGQFRIQNEGTQNGFSPAGKYFIGRDWNDTGSSEEDVTLWDAVNRRKVTTVSRPYVDLRHFDFSRDDTFFLELDHRSNTARWCKAVDASVVHEWPHRSAVVARQLSHNQKTCVTATEDGLIQVWDIATGGLVRKIPLTGMAIKSLDYRFDDRQIVVGSTGEAVIVDLRLGRVVVRLADDNEKLSSGVAQFSPDGTRVLVGSLVNAFSEASLWDAKTGDLLQTLAQPPTHAMEVSPDGKWAMSVPYNVYWSMRYHSREHSQLLKRIQNEAQLWSLDDGARISTFSVEDRELVKPHGHPIHQHGDVRSVVSTTTAIPKPAPPKWGLWIDRSVSRWQSLFEMSDDLSELLNQHDVSDTVNPVADEHSVRVTRMWLRGDGHLQRSPWSTSSSSSIMMSYRANARVHEFRSGKRRPTAAALNADRSRLLVAYSEPWETRADLQKRTLVLWDVESGESLRTYDATQESLDRGWQIDALSFSPDGRYAAVGFDYHIFIMDLETGQTDLGAKLSGYSLNGDDEFVRFSPDSRRVVLLGRQQVLWDIKQRKAQGVLSETRDPCVFSPNGKFIAFIRNRDMSLWDATTAQEIQLRAKGYHAGMAIASGDGNRIVCATEDVEREGASPILALRDFESGTELAVLELEPESREAIRSVAFSPDDRRLVTTFRNSIAFWDAQSGERLTLQNDVSSEFKHSGNGRSLYFLGPGRLLTVQRDGVNLWDVETAMAVREFVMPAAQDSRLLISRDQRRIVTISPGDMAILWDLESGERLQEFHQIPFDLIGTPESIWLSRNEQTLIARHHRGQALTFWDVETGTRTMRTDLILGVSEPQLLIER